MEREIFKAIERLNQDKDWVMGVGVFIIVYHIYIILNYRTLIKRIFRLLSKFF